MKADCMSCRGHGEVYFGEYDSFSKECSACGGSGKEHPDTAKVRALESKVKELEDETRTD